MILQKRIIILVSNLEQISNENLEFKFNLQKNIFQIP